MKRQEARDAKNLDEPSEELDRDVSEVLAAAIEVHRILGPGFLESVYEHALCLELGLRNVQYRRQAPSKVEYKGHRVGESCLDLLVCERVAVELNAVDALAPITGFRCAHISKRPGVALV